MRSTEFDVIAMFLMALGVIFTCGVLLMIGYSKASRTRKPDRPAAGEQAGGVRRESDIAEDPVQVQVTTPQPRDPARATL
jgi:hypothetical protein